MTDTRISIRVGAVLALGGLLGTACGSGGDQAAPAASTSPPVATTVGAAATEPSSSEPVDTAITESTSPATTEPPATDPPASTAPVVNPDCPSPTAVPTLSRVEPDALPLPPEEELAALPAGRYGDERLGLSLAIDVPDGFEVPLRESGMVIFFGQGGIFSLARPAGFVTEEPQRGVPPELVDIDTWLGSGLVAIESETVRTVAGYPARDLVLTLAGAANTGFVPWTSTWGIEADPVRMVVVEVGAQEPLVAVTEAQTPGDPAFTAVTDQMIDSLVIGDVGPSFDRLFAATPWDVGNLESPVDVGACTVPLVGFGGATFDLAAPARVSGQGDEIWIAAPDEPWEGTAPPFIQLVGPATATDEEDSIRRNGDRIATTADAVAAMEAAGYSLMPLDVDATLLGAEVAAFEFVGPDEPPTAWLARSHAVSVGDANITDPPFRVGIAYIAETDAGVVVARVDGESGTDDLELMRGRFDTLVETLTFR